MKFRKNTRIVAILLLAIFFILIMALLKVIDNSYSYSASLVNLDDRWTVTYNGNILKSYANIHEVDIPVVNQGDTLELTRTVPYISSNFTCLYFFTKHAMVDVYVGKNQIYTFGHDLYNITESSFHHFLNPTLFHSLNGEWGNVNGCHVDTLFL